ncbi:F-box protein CPR1-like [Mercurialis annua]|uniref:F-box protein CPR1-like n=1 Tax=Mercurialis annua TaxID=3986 RepID=UPI00215F2B28|nr:F-box protein CPR1-like [Mercurialis annua]
MEPRNHKQEKTNMFEILHEELKLEIFQKLPVRTLLCCTLVCKSWKFLIKNPTFIRNHIKNTHKNRIHSPLALCFRHYDSSMLSDTHCVYFDDTQELKTYHLHKFPLTHCRENCVLIGSINGLACIVGDDLRWPSDKPLPRPRIFIFWNPSIQKHVVLPSPNVLSNTRCFVGLGYDSDRDDYKLMRMISPDDSKDFKSIVEVFSLNSGSWKIMDSRFVPYCRASLATQAIVNGASHWCGRRRDGFIVLLRFNAIGDETVEEIGIPEELGSPEKDVWPRRQPLTFINVLVYNESTVGLFWEDWNNHEHNCLWIMKDYGLSSSWIKVLTMGKVGPQVFDPPGQRFRVSLPLGCVGVEYLYNNGRGEIFGINLVTGQGIGNPGVKRSGNEKIWVTLEKKRFELHWSQADHTRHQLSSVRPD